MTWRTHEEGFSVDFPNGWTASVVWGGNNYGDNYVSMRKPKEGWVSTTAEVGAWRTENKNIWIDEQMVRGYLNHQEVLDYMQKVSTLKDSDEAGVEIKVLSPNDMVAHVETDEEYGRRVSASKEAKRNMLDTFWTEVGGR